MTSIGRQALFSTVTSEYSVRKVNQIDPKKFNQTIFQISDQQSRDKNYEKGLEYLRTYIAALQAKANSLIEELNGIYENMLTDTIFRRADTKDTAKMLNALPNASLFDSCLATAKYNPKNLEITPYDHNVRYYTYNPLFASRALDLQNYFNESQNTDTNVGRAYYENSNGGGYHELGASVYGTLDYLWMWDLDRINATYATTKDSFIDESGLLHVRPGDVRATPEAINSGIIVEDPTLTIAGGGDPNNLQVNVTDLQPNRGVFFPEDELPSTDVDLLSVDFEEKNPFAGWTTTYNHSGSQFSANKLKKYDYTTGTWVDFNDFEGINQWGVDGSPPIIYNPVDTTPLGNPLPTYDSGSPAGHDSIHSAHFGNTKVIAYDDIVYAPHATYRFDPSLVREHFDNPVNVAGNTLTGTDIAGWGLTYTDNYNKLIDSNPSYDAGVPYDPPNTDAANNPEYGTPPRNVLDMSYYNVINQGSGIATAKNTDTSILQVNTPKFDLTDFENVTFGAKSYYKVSGYGQKYVHDVSNDYEFGDYDFLVDELSKPSSAFKIIQTSDNSQVGTATPTGRVNAASTWTYTDTDPQPNYFFSDPSSFTNNRFEYQTKTYSVGSSNMGLTLDFKEQAMDINKGLPDNGVLYPATPGPGQTYIAGIIKTAVDFRAGVDTDVINNFVRGWYDDGGVVGGNQTYPANYTPDANGGLYDVAPPRAIPINGSHNYQDYYIWGRHDMWAGDYHGLPAQDTMNAYKAGVDNATSTRWQVDDVTVKATGYSMGEMISPSIDFSNMESGFLSFWDRVETSPELIEHKDVYYSFDYDENNPSAATWTLLTEASKTGVQQQDWTSQEVEIPCAGGQKNVRVKFVFDTRRNPYVNQTGTNYSKNTDYDGWNLDDIKIVGRKIQPTDFYYYRQDLNSEFVAGMGAKSANPMVNDFNGFPNVLSQVNQGPAPTYLPNNRLTNSVTATNNSTDQVSFNIVNSIDTTAPVSNVNFSIAGASNTGGVVTRNTPFSGTYGTKITYTDAFGVTNNVQIGAGGATLGQQTNIPVNDTTSLSVGQQIVLGGQQVSITNINSFSNTIDISTTLTSALASGRLVKSPIAMGSGTPPFNVPMTVNWDITNSTANSTATSTDIYFISPNMRDSSGNVITTNDPWADKLASNDQPLNAIDELFMTNSSSQTVTSVTKPISQRELTGIDLTNASAAQLKFDYIETGSNHPSIDRAVEIVDSSGNVVFTKHFGFLSAGPQSAVIDLGPTEANVLSQNGVKVRFKVLSLDGFRDDNSEIVNASYWDIRSARVEKTAIPTDPIGTYTSVYSTGPYNITEPNSTLSYQYSALDDLTGNISSISRKVYASSDNVTWTLIDTISNPTAAGPGTNFLTRSGIGVSSGSLYLKFQTDIQVPSGVTINPKNNLFNVKGVKIDHSLGDGYNLSESNDIPYDLQRPNISFDGRRKNIDGKYTIVNNRNQITNTDYPMFANSFLTYVEQDPSLLFSQKSDTYVDWIGDNDSPPVRILEPNTGKVITQAKGNFTIKDDGLNQYYDVNSNGDLYGLYVDEALAINTGKIVGKTSKASDIDTGETGWMNAVSNGSGVWIPPASDALTTKYDEGGGKGFKNMTIWGKRTFLIDPDNLPPAGSQMQISANDDAFLYINGYNVKSTAYQFTGNNTAGTLTMIDTSDYTVGSYAMINGIIARIDSKTATSINVTFEHSLSASQLATFTNIDKFGRVTDKSPSTVYHAEIARDKFNNEIRVTSSVPQGSKTISLNSVDFLTGGQRVLINNESILIQSVDTVAKTITLLDPIKNDIISNSFVATKFEDASASASAPPPVAPPVAPTPPSITPPISSFETNSSGTSPNFSIEPLLRSGFNTIGVKATEDRGTGENFKVTGSGFTALGDTFSSGTTGIDTDSKWAVKISPNGYSGLLSSYDYSTGTWTNDSASYLSENEKNALFQTDKIEQKELKVHFINQDQNGVGRFSRIKDIQVTVTGEPTVQTFQTTNYSTASLMDGYVTTQLENGYYNGVSQDGIYDSLKFEPTNDLNYFTDNGKADIKVFINKDSNIVNDATLMVKVDYVEDVNGNGLIDAIEEANVKTRYMGMQDTRTNTSPNPYSTAPNPVITGVAERYEYAKTTSSAFAINSSSINVADATNFSIGDYIRVEDIATGNHQMVQIVTKSAPTGAATITVSSPIQFASPSGSNINSYDILSDVNSQASSKIYSGSDYYVNGNTTVNTQYLVASNGRSGGANVTGNQNQITKRLKEVLDNAEYADVIKYGLLDEIYIAATVSDNRGDQIVGKLLLNWDWQRKRLGLTQGSFSAVYKS